MNPGRLGVSEPRRATSRDVAGPTWPGVAAAVLAASGATALSWLAFGRQELADVVMIYLLGIVLVAMRFGYGHSLFATALSIVTFDFFFIPPYLSFAVSDSRHVATFGVMLFVAVVISGLAQRFRAHAESAEHRETRTAHLYALTSALAHAQSTPKLLEVATLHVQDVFGGQACLLLPDADGALAHPPGARGAFTLDANERGVAEWVWLHQRPGGLHTQMPLGARALYVPLRGARGAVGVLGVLPDDVERLVDPEEQQMLATFAVQIAATIERVQLVDEAHEARLDVERERLKNSLLSSVSHDLRTPLAVIKGAATTLLDRVRPADAAARTDLLSTIAEETDRLNRLVRNLLDMTRVEAGALRVVKEWQPIEEVVGAALDRLDDRLGARRVTTNLPDDLPLVPIDSVLVEQVLINLLENALKYTQPGATIDISARAGEACLEITVADHGPGIPSGEEDRIFEKFYRASGAVGGVGLGLTICRGVVAAHGGRMWAENVAGAGAAFHFTLPIEGTPPSAPPQELSRAG